MRPYERRSEAVEEWALLVFLFSCFLLAFFKDVFPVLDKGLTAALFAGVFFVLKQIRDLRLEIRSREEFAEKFFPSAKDFYSSAARAVDRARQEVCATYFRDAAPDEYAGKEAVQYFDRVVRFAREQGAVRRIIKVDNASLANWCQRQAELADEVAGYYVRVLNLPAGSVEPMNMAILDRSVVYLAFAGPTDQQLGGVRPPGSQLAGFLQARFDDHWRIATPVDKYVRTKEFQDLLPQPPSSTGTFGATRA
jgi:hypothetical protein